MNDSQATAKRRPGRERRLREIVRLLRSGVDRMEDIAVAVEVSESTVRRDLASLEAEGEIARTYGGALPSRVFQEIRLGERTGIEVAAKTRIGATAAEWVEDGATIFVDAGSAWGRLETGWTLVTDEAAESRLAPFARACVQVVSVPGELLEGPESRLPGGLAS